MADFALFSLMKILAKVNSVETLLRISNDPRLQSKVPGYKVTMSFGLHYGWAIEGAIGSQFKVDLSYLSPNVNLASRLAAASFQYGVNILFS